MAVFTCARYPNLVVKLGNDGPIITFTAGSVDVVDAEAASELVQFARHNPDYGIDSPDVPIPPPFADLDADMAVVFDNPESKAGGVLKATFATTRRALAPLKAMLDKGRTASVLVLGDSTGNATDEWVYLSAQEIATRYPAHTVRHRVWNIATEKWDPPTVIQAGAAGDRYIEFDGVTSAALLAGDSAVNSITGDIDIRIKVAADDYAAAGPFTLAAKFGNAPQRSWQFYLAGGWLNFRWSADGSALIATSVNANGLGALPANGVARWFRVTLDVDNGAAGNTCTYYYSDDGSTWTQIGSAQVTAGVTSIADTTSPLNLGARSDGTTERFDGKIYEVEIRNGIDGPLVAPTLVDLWTVWPSTFNGVFSGAPVLDVWNGSGSGYKMDDLINATRMPKMAGALGQTTTIVSCSHNDFGEIEAAYWTKWDTLVAHIQSRAAQSSLAFTAQNPRIAPASFITQHETRAAMIHGYAQRKGAAVIDAFKAFENAGVALSTLISAADGIHPTAAGSQVWADEVMASFV